MPMRVLRQTTVFDGSETRELCSATFPDVAVMPSGRILVSFKGAPSKGPYNTGENGYTCRSDDGGHTFTAPHAPFGTLLIDGKTPAHVRSFQLLPIGGETVFGVASVVENTADGLPYFNEETEAIKDTRLFAFFSHDGGSTFTDPVPIPMTAQYRDMACVLTGPPVLLGDGRIMVNFEVYKRYYDTRPIDHSAACIFSHDGGRTWGTEVTIYQNPDVYAWDHRAGRMSGGGIADFVWTFDRKTNDYRNIPRLESRDGVRWARFDDVGLSGQAGNPVLLDDGRMALVWFDRTGVPTLKLALSDDDGRTFDAPFTVYEHRAPKALHDKSAYAEAWDEMGKFTAGHCFAANAGKNRLYVIYYAGPAKDRTNIKLAVVELDQHF